MAPVLYFFGPSPPARTALLAAKVLEVDVDVKIIDLFKNEHNSPEFLKINPQHIIPTLVDDDLVIWESGAIASYLANAYGKDDLLYPKDPKKRALVDHRLHFANGTLFTRLRAMCVSKHSFNVSFKFPIFFLGQKTLDADRKREVEEAVGLIDTFLEGRKFVAGDHYTIADISLVTLVSSLDAAGWKFPNFKNVVDWLERCKREIPGYDEYNQVGADQFGAALSSKLDPPNQF